MTIAGCLKDSNCCRVTDSAAVFCQASPWSCFIAWWVFKVNPRQWIPLLSFGPGPEHPLSFSAWVLGGITLDSFGFVGDSCSSSWDFHCCWVLCLVFSLTTGSRTSPQTLSGKLLLVFAGFCYPCYYLLLVEKVPNWPPFGAQTWHSMSRLAEDFLPAPSLFKVILAWKIFFFYLYLCLYGSL